MNYNRRHGLGTRSFVKSIPGPTAERLADRAVNEHEPEVRTAKILLLGASDSGKSTVVKQVPILPIFVYKYLYNNNNTCK
jgi:hypothetical protein